MSVPSVTGRDLNAKWMAGKLPADSMHGATPGNALAHAADAKAKALMPPHDGWTEATPRDEEDPKAPPRSKPTVKQEPGFSTVGTDVIFAPLPPVQYLVGALDICPGAPTMFAGYGFSGKTLAAQSMALSVAAGQRMWGQYVVGDQGPVLHLDYEQGSHLTFSRYQRLAWSLGLAPQELQLSVAVMPSIYLDTPAAALALARATDGHRLAIVDSLRACAPSVDENSSDVRKVLDLMTRTSELNGCCFLIIHHASKPAAKDSGRGARHSIRGSGALFDACGSVLVFSAEKGEPIKVSHEKARTSGRPADEFELVVVDDDDEGRNPRVGLSVEATAAARTEKRDDTDQVCREVLDAITDEPGLSTNELKTRVRRKVTTVLAAIDNLERTGRIEKVPGQRNRSNWRKKSDHA